MGANAGDEESSESEKDDSNVFSFDLAAKAAYMEKINQEKKDKKKKTQECISCQLIDTGVYILQNTMVVGGWLLGKKYEN